MSQAPHVIRGARKGLKLGQGTLEDSLMVALLDTYCGLYMAQTAENLARKYDISREEQDAFALRSQQRATKAQAAGLLAQEIVPVPVGKKGDMIEHDDHPRPDTTMEGLAKLRPAFSKDGFVTAGNASGIVDGAAMLVMTSSDKAAAKWKKPLGRIVSRHMTDRAIITGAVPIPTTEAAFAARAEQHRRELHVHCYRMLGNFQEAEDHVQETFLRAWRGRSSFKGELFRAWLYKIATNTCLDTLKRTKRRAGGTFAEVAWLQPFPDQLLDLVAPAEDEPDAVVVARETIELTFIALIQTLPARQRAALILRDVLGYRAAEAALIMDCTQESVTSALKRARAALQYQRAQSPDRAPPPPGSATERALVQRFTQAYEAGDVDGLVALLTEDAWLIMPPVPLRYQGRALAARFWSATAFRPGRSGRLVPVRANGQPAFGLYVRDPQAPVAHATGILVLTLAGSLVSAVTGFPDNSTLSLFGLPRTLPG